MNELHIPPSANWYSSNIFECANDNTVVYAFRSHIIIINPRDASEPADIQRISFAHTEKVLGLSLNHASWNDPDKLVASIGEDKYVRLWDLKTRSLRMAHKEHEKDSVNLVGVSLLKDRVISINEKGLIIIWRISTKKTNKLRDVIAHKSKVRCISTCPHANWLIAVGFQDGLTAIVDLRKEKFLYKLPGGNTSITGLSWCPTPYNIYKTEVGTYIYSILKRNNSWNNDTNNEVVNKATNINAKEISQSDDSTVSEEQIEENLSEFNDDEKDILDVDTPNYGFENRRFKTYKKVENKNPWGSVTFDDNDTESTLNETNSTSDFLKDCELLRSLINNSTKVDCRDDKNDEDIVKKLNKQDMQEDISPEVNENNEKEISNKRFISKSSDNEYLLATINKDGVVNIWRALTDGRQQLYLHSPNRIKKCWDNTKWQAICWAKPNILLVSTPMNRLYCWNLLPPIDDLNKMKSKNIMIEPRLIHQDHNNSIFTINVPYKIYPEVEITKSWESLNDFYVWTTSKDRWILRTTIGTQIKHLTSYCCFGAGINVIAPSTIDPTKIALGVHDGTIKIWDLNMPHIQEITMTKLVAGQEKIFALDWHPIKENCVAYGTCNGKVAQFITTSKKRDLFSQYHTTCVYKVQWAPNPVKENEYALYSCSMGNLIYHDETEFAAEPHIIDIDEGRPHTFDWKPDFSILAVGTKEATVKLLSNKFEVYETLYMQKKAVQCLAWHPHSTIADSGISPYANYLAVSTNEKNIFIYNCRKFEDRDNGEKSQLIAILEGHKSCVKCLSWCPQIGGRLVSGGEDNIIMVWDVITHILLSTYKFDSKEMVGSLLWSPLDADLIIVGTKDNSLIIFRITKHPPLTYNSEKKKKTQKSVATNEDVTPENLISSDPPEKYKRICILPNVTRLQNPERNVQICKNLLEICDKKSENNYDSDNDSSEDEQSADLINKISIEQFFSSRKNMINILNFEQNTHEKKQHWDLAHNISLWKGDLAQSIERALKTGAIEPWLINMAPMVSYELWSKLCLQYAEILAEDGKGIEASSYYIACHQIQKAIEVLCSCNSYREAFALATCRLPPNDPLISYIYEQWAHYAIIVGNYELAAQCYIKLEKYSEAGIYLNKRTNPEALELALELAKRSNNHDLEIAVNAKLDLIKEQEKISDEMEKENKIIKISQSRFEAMLSSLNNAKINDSDDNSDLNGSHKD